MSIASAIFEPISLSSFAEIVATCAICLESGISLESFEMKLITLSLARSIPFLISMGFAPAVTFFKPSAIIDCASTVAVVVPSPATSDVFDATSFTICAPTFSN